MKTAFITGANRGIGRGFVEYLLDHDYQVFAGVRNPSEFKHNLKTDSNKLIILSLDLASDKSIIKVSEDISERTDHLDLLINNAGINKDSATGGKKDLVCKLSSLDRISLQRMFDINSIAPMILVKELSKLMKLNPSFIINISSDRASFHDEYINSNGNYGYRASKIALNMFTFCSLYDLPKNVKTFAVHPGGVKTDMNPNGEDLTYNQAEKIIKITETWKEEWNGKFLRYDGTLYPL